MHLSLFFVKYIKRKKKTFRLFSFIDTVYRADFGRMRKGSAVGTWRSSNKPIIFICGVLAVEHIARSVNTPVVTSRIEWSNTVRKRATH